MQPTENFEQDVRTREEWLQSLREESPVIWVDRNNETMMVRISTINFNSHVKVKIARLRSWRLDNERRCHDVEVRLSDGVCLFGDGMIVPPTYQESLAAELAGKDWFSLPESVLLAVKKALDEPRGDEWRTLESITEATDDTVLCERK